MRFRTWPVAALGLVSLLALIAGSMLTASRRAQEIYTQLDERCRAIGRDPREISRSVQTHAFTDDPERTRRTVLELQEIGIDHVVLNLMKPFHRSLVHWAAEQIIAPLS